MNKMRVFLAWCAVGCAALPRVADAQSIDVMGARAAGMAGAFVGVADDASATYWNPAGLAAGSYFSLALDGGTERAASERSPRGRKQSSFLIGATIPALGLTYYRLQRAFATPDALLVSGDGAVSGRNSPGAAPVRLESLVTHHAGVTVVQSVYPNVAVGATLKLVRGIAASEPLGLVTAEDALDREGLQGRGNNRFDADLGVMATVRGMKAGLTLRNLREPEFRAPDGARTLKLERQARAGVSYAVAANWLLAADVDLLETTDAFGGRRDAAFGVEGRLGRRVRVRSGLRLNASGSSDEFEGSDRAFALGGSFSGPPHQFSSMLLRCWVATGPAKV